MEAFKDALPEVLHTEINVRVFKFKDLKREHTVLEVEILVLGS